MPEKDEVLEKCKAQIERKLAWGSSAQWANRDFAELSERIFAETGVQLSATTLKRLWGKIEYRSAPHPDTLEALAAFAGFENWRNLKLACATSATEPPKLAAPRPRTIPFFDFLKKKKRHALVLLALALGFLAYRWTRPAQFSPDDFAFDSRPLSKGIPNSVVFRYDARAAGPHDSVFIQQSWDPRRRAAVARDGHEHSAIYYRPGVFMAKLVVGGQVVQEHRLFIPTDGWLAYIEQSPVPVYLDRSVFDRDSCLEVLPEVVAAHNIALQPEAPTVCITDVRQFDSLTTANFLLEAELRNHFQAGSAICRSSEAVLLTTRGPLVLPLAMPGCTGGLTLHIPHRNIEASEADLSGFGCDLSRWVALRCGTGDDGKIFVEVDGKPAYSFDWPVAAPSEIIGTQFNFKGGGAVRRVRLEKKNQKQ